MSEPVNIRFVFDDENQTLVWLFSRSVPWVQFNRAAAEEMVKKFQEFLDRKPPAVKNPVQKMHLKLVVEDADEPIP